MHPPSAVTSSATWGRHQPASMGGWDGQALVCPTMGLPPVPHSAPPHCMGGEGVVGGVEAERGCMDAVESACGAKGPGRVAFVEPLGGACLRHGGLAHGAGVGTVLPAARVTRPPLPPCACTGPGVSAGNAASPGLGMQTPVPPTPSAGEPAQTGSEVLGGESHGCHWPWLLLAPPAQVVQHLHPRHSQPGAAQPRELPAATRRASVCTSA